MSVCVCWLVRREERCIIPSRPNIFGACVCGATPLRCLLYLAREQENKEFAVFGGKEENKREAEREGGRQLLGLPSLYLTIRPPAEKKI
jgi:hypothetical protein